jgi:putative hemolysin
MYSGESLIAPFGEFISKQGVNPEFSAIIARLIIILIITYITLVIGELFPKRLALNSPEKIASLIIAPMNFLSKLFYPIVWLLSVSIQGMMRLFDIKKIDDKVTEEEFMGMMADSVEDGEITEEQHEMAERVFSMDDRDVASLMTHRTELEWLDVEDDLDKVKSKLAQHVHYIYPVASKNLDNVKGVVYLKDVFSRLDGFKNVGEIMREPQYLHESVSVYDALETFKKNKIHYALIIDEFGSVQGLVTMNNILESLVGNASELETEDDEDEFVKREDGTYLVGGQYPFYDFLSHFDMEDFYQDNNYNTISGLLFSKIGTIPKIGEKVEWERFIFEVVDMDFTRIDKVLVTIKPEVIRTEDEE